MWYLASHISSFEGAVRDDSGTGDSRRYACRKCSLIFSKIEFLEAHMTRLHPVVGPFRCTECAFETKYHSMFLLHLKVQPILTAFPMFQLILWRQRYIRSFVVPNFPTFMADRYASSILVYCWTSKHKLYFQELYASMFTKYKYYRSYRSLMPQRRKRRISN